LKASKIEVGGNGVGAYKGPLSKASGAAIRTGWAWRGAAA
jgi:hypothetical protein